MPSVSVRNHSLSEEERFVIMRISTLNDLLKRRAASLAEKGFLVRKRSTADSREILLALTKRGRKLAEEMVQASLTRNDELIAGYPSGKIRELVGMLDELIQRTRAMVASDETRAG
jgi:DNA-binding MarR family transcriptional regulator